MCTCNKCYVFVICLLAFALSSLICRTCVIYHHLLPTYIYHVMYCCCIEDLKIAKIIRSISLILNVLLSRSLSYSDRHTHYIIIVLFNDVAL